MMAFEFSLPKDSFTPIRPLKIEQLFSPHLKTTPNRVSDLTYRIPAPVTTHLSCDFNDISIGPPEEGSKFPRQSTCLKSGRQSGSENGSPATDAIASNVLLDSTNLNNHIDAIPQYKPYYLVKDVQPIRATCFHPGGEVFAIGSNSRALRIYKYPSEEEFDCFSPIDRPKEPTKLFAFLQIHKGSVYCTSFNDTGGLLASGSNDQSVHLVKYNSKKHAPEGSAYKLTMHSGTVRDLCFMHNTGETSSSWLVSAGAGSHEVYVTDCCSMKTVQHFSGHESTVMSLNCWNDSPVFVSGSLDGTIRIWDVRIKRCTSTISTRKPGGDMSGDKAPVCAVRVEQSGKLLVSGHKDGRCMLYDIRGDRALQIFQAHKDEVRTLNFSPKSYYLLTGGYDHKVKLIDLQGDDLTKKLPSVEIAELNDKVVQTAWHPTDYTFTTTSADGSAYLWAMPELATKL